GVDFTDLQSRVNVLIKQFDDAVVQLNTVLGPVTPTTFTGEIKEKILFARIELSKFDLPDAWPDIPDETTDSITQFISVSKSLLKAGQQALTNAHAIISSMAES